MRRKYVDPLETVGWLNRGRDAIDGRKVVFKKGINEEENTQKTRLPTSLVRKDIFSEDRLKEYLNCVKKNARKTRVVKSILCMQMKDWMGRSENNLIDQYDEETVLLQILQEDTEVGDVVRKLKNR